MYVGIYISLLNISAVLKEIFFFYNYIFRILLFIAHYCILYRYKKDELESFIIDKEYKY